jgi:uncharacterized protein YbaR (Trm112 family)
MTDAAHAIPMAIRDLLACPKCRGPLTDGVLGEKGAQPLAEALVCGTCGLAYPVEGGIPVLLIERATPCARAV